MNERICHIVGAGELFGQPIRRGEQDLLIAADGGYARLRAANGPKPDLLMGDFDSLSDRPDDVEILAFGPEKDDTDMMLAIKYGYERGYRSFRLYGGVGGRLSHTIANMQALTYLSRRGAKAVLYGENAETTAITRGEIAFPQNARGMVSVFAHGGTARGVYIENMKYPLADYTLTCDFPLGVSNELLSAPARVSVREGTLIIVWEKNEGSTR